MIIFSMASRIPDIELLRAFRQVAVDLSFTRAASAMHVTQSAVSHRVKRLERQLGKVLFRRNPHDVQLTTAGKALLTQISPALEQLERTFDQTNAQAKRVLKIELESAFASNWLTPRLGDFMAKHPDANVQFAFSTREPEFSEGTEVAIKWGKGGWSGLRSTWLMGSEVTPMYAPSLMRETPLKSTQDLTRHTLLHDRDTASWREWAKSADVKGLMIDGGHVYDDTLALQQAAIDGHGVALYPVELGQRSVARGDLIIPFPSLVFPGPGSYYLLTKPRDLSPMATSFILWLEGAVRSLA